MINVLENQWWSVTNMLLYRKMAEISPSSRRCSWLSHRLEPGLGRNENDSMIVFDLTIQLFSRIHVNMIGRQKQWIDYLTREYGR